MSNNLPALAAHASEVLEGEIIHTGFPTPERQYEQAARWASLLWAAGYPAELHGTGEPAPFNREWRVYAGWNGKQIASIDIDGCGASWHGPDDLWLTVIGPSEGVLA